jgi:pyrroline-5-carboxylate reductase
MGGALIGGMITGKAAKPADIRIFDQDSKKVSGLCRARKVRAASSSVEATRRSDIVFLCVKPGQIAGVLPEVSAGVTRSSKRKIIVSIAAGVTLSRLESGLPRGTCVVRVMPNTPALLGAGMVVLSGGRRASARDVRLVRRLLSTVGETAVLGERHMDAVTAVSGSGPAYVFYLCEVMREACAALGLPPAASELLCRQTIFGAGLMLKKLPASARDLRVQVTSPGGTTEAAVKYLEKSRVRRYISDAVRTAAKRSRELAG